MPDINRWSVNYGCEEWQDSDDFLFDEQSAREKFEELKESWPYWGLYPATYLTLKLNDEIVDKVIIEEEEDSATDS